VKEYDVYLPLSYNDGRSVEPEKISRSKALLLKEFGGLTHFPQENEGLWKLGRITFRDKVVILRVLSDEPEKARAFLSQFRVAMQTDLDQEDLLIVEREVQPVR
jgi:hypothetical protein